VDPNLLQIPQSVGTGSVAITANLAGLSGQSNAGVAFFTAPPAVTALTPAFGSVAGGTPVRLTGTTLTGATSVTFGGASAQFSVDTATQITVFATPPAPGGITGPVTVRVVTPSGTATATFTYN